MCDLMHLIDVLFYSPGDQSVYSEANGQCGITEGPLKLEQTFFPLISLI